ncbi:hypothetical protein [Alteromonas macleodii]|jgi:hypothetical protein|uniref:hypothetical protein n=1 Tax=Alteromonas macleodii TaxID=28108 RepID=UPI00313FEE80|tara:strand:+ start:90594 stop:91016 length:423 start_codon:yes stop_codon:yes gene_type:complete
MHTQLATTNARNIIIHASLADIEATRSHRFTVSFDGEQYQAVFPEPLSELSCGFTTKQEAWCYVVTERVKHPQGNIWPLDNAIYVAEILWGVFSDVTTNDDDYIEQPFLHFDVGTERFEIWLWFENYFDLSVMTDLMGAE